MFLKEIELFLFLNTSFGIMIFISKYYMINIEIAQFIVAVEVLLAILCLTFLYCLHSTFSLHRKKICHLINFYLNQFSTNYIFYNNTYKRIIFFKEIKIPGIAI